MYLSFVKNCIRNAVFSCMVSFRKIIKRSRDAVFSLRFASPKTNLRDSRFRIMLFLFHWKLKSPVNLRPCVWLGFKVFLQRSNPYVRGKFSAGVG